MALSSWNNIDNFSLQSDEYYCAFLDILGYKNKSDSFFNGTFNLHGRYERALSESMRILNNMSRLGIVNTSHLGVRFFSDSIIVTHPKHLNKVDALYSVLLFCRVFAAHLSFEGLFIRGGISQGPHVEKVNAEHNFSFLSSKALERAYKLESEKAVYPRILIDEILIQDLDDYSITLVVKDGVDYMLHFSPQLINSNGENQIEIKLEMEDIFSIYKSESDQRVKDKYKWLLCYYYWTLKITPNVKISKFKKFKLGDISGFSLIF